MSGPGRQKSDDELWQLLDRPGTWAVRGGPAFPTPQNTLRLALHYVRILTNRGIEVTGIERLSEDEILVQPLQIRRLMARLGLLKE
jgi:hypothetical protein